MSTIYVILRETGEYSDRDVEPIRYALTEAEAKAAVDRADAERARSGEKPPFPDGEELRPYGYQMPDGSWVVGAGCGTAPKEARFTRKPDADVIQARFDAAVAAYKEACRAMGCVDPHGPTDYARYYYEPVLALP